MNSELMPVLLIMLGQLAHALLRTSAISLIAERKIYKLIIVNALANLVRLIVLSNGVMAVIDGNLINIAAVVIGQGIGDFIAMRFTKQDLTD